MDTRLAAMNAELQHTRPQRTRVEPENIRGAIWTFDSPTSVLQRINDVIAFDLSQRFGLEGMLVWRRFKTVHQLEHASCRVNDSAFDCIRQFPDVPRPRMRLQFL